MAFVKSVPTEEESVAAVMRRYPQMAMPMMEFSEAILRTGECAFTHEERELIGAFATGLNNLSLIHISEPTRPRLVSRMPSSA